MSIHESKLVSLWVCLSVKVLLELGKTRPECLDFLFCLVLLLRSGCALTKVVPYCVNSQCSQKLYFTGSFDNILWVEGWLCPKWMYEWHHLPGAVHTAQTDKCYILGNRQGGVPPFIRVNCERGALGLSKTISGKPGPGTHWARQSEKRGFASLA